MRELNFFNPYLSPRRSIKVGQLQVILAIVFLLLVCGSIYSWNIIRIVKYSKDIYDYNAFMTDPANIAAVKNYTETKQRVDIIQQYMQGFAPIEAELDAKSIVSSALINKLNTALPHEVYLENMNITMESVQISGVGTSRNVIAQYEHNLLKLGIFEDVFIDIIKIETEGGSAFEFTANCLLAGGASYEAKQ
ncbi:MAG TPA: PilN domain-containing protein [Patescibacteria group bacterium]|nr:PilN domain-containing protein [Patescibacteria group bacterium]